MTESNSSGKSCPKCHLINPSTAKVCDCGYNFETGQNKDEGELTSRSHWPWHLLPWLILAFGIISFLIGLVRITEDPDAMGGAAAWTICFMLFAVPVIPVGIFIVLRTWSHSKLWPAIGIAFAVFVLLFLFIGILVAGFAFR